MIRLLYIMKRCNQKLQQERLKRTLVYGGKRKESIILFYICEALIELSEKVIHFPRRHAEAWNVILREAFGFCCNAF